MRGEGIPAGQEIDRRPDETGQDVAFGVGERVVVRIEDVGVEQPGGPRRQGVRHPGDVPEAELPVASVQPSDAIELERERPGQRNGQGNSKQGEHPLCAPVRESGMRAYGSMASP